MSIYRVMLFLAVVTATSLELFAQQNRDIPPAGLPPEAVKKTPSSGLPPDSVRKTPEVAPPASVRPKPSTEKLPLPTDNDPETPGPAIGTSPADVDTLTRGPVHEAFAKPLFQTVAVPALVTEKPPENINEIPAATRPEGSIWIPGYWSYDDEGKRFVWVSGTWRVPPYGHRWVPGYWSDRSKGFARVAGFWISDSINQVRYLPELPEERDAGPATAPPSEAHFWFPGGWVYDGSRYRWQEGYWARSHANWMWIPNQYVWTPGGLVFVNGYWDYSLERRGLLLAPVAFRDPIYRNPQFTFTPSIAVNLSRLPYHLFVRPQYQSYYFGDYFDASYANYYFPWFAFEQWRGYEPLHYFTRTQLGADWEIALRDRFERFRDNPDERPPREFVAMRDRLPEDRSDEMEVALPVDAPNRNERISARRLLLVPEAERRSIARESQEQYATIHEARIAVERDRRVALKPNVDDSIAERTAPVLNLPVVPRTARRDPLDGDATRNGGDGVRVKVDPRFAPNRRNRESGAFDQNKGLGAPGEKRGIDSSGDNRRGLVQPGERRGVDRSGDENRRGLEMPGERRGETVNRRTPQTIRE